MKIRRLHSFLLMISLAILILAFQNCSPEAFSTTTGNSTTGIQPTSTLTANNLTFAANINVQLAISVADILGGNTAPSGQTLSLQSVGTPSIGKLSQAGSQYDFLSANLGNSQFNYTIKDTSGSTATATITVVVLGPTGATGSFYACNLYGDLYVLDPFQGTLENLVNLTYNGSTIGLNDLAMDSSANLYGKDPNNNIYKVNVTTGASTLYIDNLIPSSYFAGGLTILPNGNFVTSKNSFTSSPSSIVSVNPSTLVETVLVPTSAGYSMTQASENQIEGDVKYLPDGYLYWTVVDSSTQLCANYSGPGNQAIVQINPTTGATKELVCLTQPDVTGLGYANQTLYGFSEGGNLVEINTSTGAITLINSTGDTFIGATSNPALW